MKTELLTGFVKAASDRGFDDDEIAQLWSNTMKCKEARELYQALPDSQDPVDSEKLYFLSAIKKAADISAEVARLKEEIKLK